MAAPGSGVILISNPAENEGPNILAATLTVTSLALVAVVTRLYVRINMIKSFGWDDALMSFAIAIAVAGQIVIIPEVYYGAGRHIGDVDGADYMVGMKLNFITQPMFLVAICVVKLAVGSALLRIASTKFYRYIIISIMGFMGFYTTGCFFTILFQCTDVRILWDPTVQATCWTTETLQALSYTNAALNILTDLLFAVVIPTPMLWSLNVNRRTRYSLLAILGLGVFACASAFIKVGYLVNYGKLGDWLWDSRNITIWTVVETNVGIIAGSLPCIRPLVKGVLGSVYGKSSRKTDPISGSAYHGRSTIKSSKDRSNWQTLSSGRREPGDETSSECAFNTGAREEYELGRHHGTSKSDTAVKTVILADVDAKSSDESVDQVGLARGDSLAGRRGITKTTTMEMTFSDFK